MQYSCATRLGTITIELRLTDHRCRPTTILVYRLHISSPRHYYVHTGTRPSESVFSVDFVDGKTRTKRKQNVEWFIDGFCFRSTATSDERRPTIGRQKIFARGRTMPLDDPQETPSPSPPPSLWALWRTFVIIIIVTVVLLLFLLIIIFFFYLHVSKRFRWRHFACLYTAQAHGNVSRSIVFNILIKILVFNNSTSKRVDTCTRARLFSYSAETFVSYTAMILVGRGNKDRRGEGGKKKQIVNYWTVREIGLVMRRPWANRKTTGTVTVDGNNTTVDREQQ